MAKTKTKSYQHVEELNHQMMEETLRGLVTLLSKQETSLPPSVSHDSSQALLAAVGAVGRAMGIEIYPPTSQNLDHLKNPLEAIARASHIRTRRITLSQCWWEKISDPLLGFSGEEAIALIPTGNTYTAYIPAQKSHISVNSAFAETLNPTAYTFYRPFPQLITASSLLRLLLHGRLKDLWLIVFMGISMTMLGMLVPQATGILIDYVIPDSNRTILIHLALGLIAAALGTVAFQWVQTMALLRFSTGADSTIQAALWDRLLNLPSTFFRDYTVGDLSSRVGAVNQIQQILSGTVLKTIFSSLFSILNLGLLLFYDAKLALLAIAIALIYVILTLFSGLISLRQMRPLIEQQGLLLGTMVQLINGVAKLRVAGAEARAFAYWGKQYRQQLRLVLSTQQIEDTLESITVILPTFTNVLVFYTATQMLQQQDETLSIGVFFAFNAALGSFIGGTSSLSETVIDVLNIIPLWQRAQPILHATPEINHNQRDPGILTGQLKLDRITFRYQPQGQLILQDINLRAEAGEFIAIVGPSGSGKSTLFRLLLGFEQSESGWVLYDGQDLAGLDVQSVRRQLGVVLQNGRLNSASIFDNIVGNSLITLDDAWEAAARAGLAEDIQQMPMGMHTVVSEGGSNLSGGQRQRLMIARALALKPKILLFDEATSALDNRTQAIVSASLESMQVTRIAIAHRLSTIRGADRIYVLDQGRIIQEGTFSQLMRQEGLFSTLMARQML
jgi:NHLM bacteriocin system ABC transporter ATP-binding protein